MISAADFIRMFRATLDVYDSCQMTKQTFALQVWLTTRPGSYTEVTDITAEVKAKLADMPWADVIDKVTTTNYIIDPEIMPNKTPSSVVVEVLGVDGAKVYQDLANVQAAHIRNVIDEVGREMGLPMADMDGKALEYEIDSHGNVTVSGLIPGGGADDIESQVADFISKMDSVFGGGDDDGRDA